MGNRLKEIFTNEIPSFKETFIFRNSEAKDRFSDAIKEVQDNGRTVKVDGIESIETSIKNGKSLFPYSTQNDLYDFVIGPSKTQKSYELSIEYGKKTLIMGEYYTSKCLVMETSTDDIIYLKLEIEKESRKLHLQFRAQQKNAKCIYEIVEYFMLIEALLNKLFGKAYISEDLESSENDVFKIGQIRNYIASCISIFKKALWIENNLSIAFIPNELTDDIESRRDLEEVYLLLKEKVVIRLNGRLNVSDEAGITIDQQYESIKKGSDIDLTFLGKSEYFIWGKQISLHTANLLTNIYAKDVLQMQDGKTKILYDEEKGTPMYISYRGFLTEEDAREEMKKIIDAKEKYVNALTLDEYMK